jgi:Holliday junction resolvasome RuvABC endonuclease subunit
VLRGADLIDAGVLTLRHVPPRHRLAHIRHAFERWIRADRPDVLVVEDMPSRPMDSEVGLPSLGRLLRRLASANRMELATYSARAVRRSLLNNGWAGKPEVVAPLVGRYTQLRVYRGQDRKWKARYWHNMFDAIALGRHHLDLIQPLSRSR